MFFSYVKYKIRTMVLFVSFGFIFAVVFYLYGLPKSPVIYSGFLCLIIAFLALFIDFYAFKKRHEHLKLLLNYVSGCAERLPKPCSLIELDYQELLRLFQKECQSLVSDVDTNKTEMMDFYTLWVHQIKTPIAAVGVLLQETQCEEKAQMRQELFKIERYTELVLGYLRIDSMSLDMAFCKCSLEELVKQAVKKYAPMFIHKKLKLEMQGLDKIVLTDEKWLVFVLEQLLSNALKYTNSGSIGIFVKEERLIIQDTGIGIGKEDIPRVFERGFTGFNGRMDKKSTGLGLYLCKKTLDKLNHPIYLFSEEGIGTRVEIDLSQKEIFIA